MRRALITAGLLLAAALPARADEDATLRKVVEALDRWDLPAFSEEAEALKASHSVDALEALAMVRFQQGRYPEAVALLRQLESKVGQHKDFAETARLIFKTEAVTHDFVEKKGAHFLVRYSPTSPDSILVDWALETLEAQRAALEQDFGWVPPEVVPVEIFPTADKFAVVTTLTREEIETTGTIALCKFNKLMVTTPGSLAYGYPWRDTLAHEYTHYVMARATANKMPIWLHEGLAKFQEVRWRRPKGGEPSVTTEAVLAEAMARNYWVPLKKMHPSIAKLPSAFDATLAFAEVESLIGYLIETQGYPGIQKLFADLKQDQAMDVALLQIYGVGLEGLYSRWRSWLEQHPPRPHQELEVMPTVLKDPGADVDSSGAARKGLSDQAADHLHLGDLLGGETRPDAARVEYTMARDAEKEAKSRGGHAPIFEYKIAYSYLLQNKFDEARKHLGLVLASYPTFAPALKAMGLVELRIGDPHKARALLEETLWLAPFDVDPRDNLFQLLAEACEKTGDKPCARQSNEKLSELLRLLMGGRTPLAAVQSPNQTPAPNP